MATGGGPSIPDLPADPLLDMSVPYLLHSVDQEHDSDANALRSSSSTPVTHSSLSSLTETPILDQESSDFNEDSPSPVSSQSELCTRGTRVSPIPKYDDEVELILSCARDEPVSSCVSVAPLASSSTKRKVGGPTPTNSGKGKCLPTSCSSVVSAGETPNLNTSITGAVCFTSNAKGRLGVLREEQEERMKQLAIASQQRDELHQLCVKEAENVAQERADLHAINMQAALRNQEELANAAKERAQLHAMHMQVAQAAVLVAEEELAYKRLCRSHTANRDRSPQP